MFGESGTRSKDKSAMGPYAADAAARRMKYGKRIKFLSKNEVIEKYKELRESLAEMKHTLHDVVSNYDPDHHQDGGPVSQGHEERVRELKDKISRIQKRMDEIRDQ
jgi:hypothetical protein